MAFKLKSGNTPLFKKMGATPAYQVDDTNDDTGEEAKDLTEQIQVNKKKTLINKAKGTLVAGFTGGLDAVYGTGKVQPSSGVEFEKKEGECIEGVNTITGEPCTKEESEGKKEKKAGRSFADIIFGRDKNKKVDGE